MLRMVLTFSLLACIACATADADGGPSLERVVVPPCHVGGCSGQVCSEREGVVTTCEWLPEYACYANARCEPQADGKCNWTQTPELVACIEAARQK